MLGPRDILDLRRRIDALMTRAGELGLPGTHRTVREQAALIEIDAIDTKVRLRDCTLKDDPGARLVIERELARLERRCVDLAAWLITHDPDAEFTDATVEPPARRGRAKRA